jgi:hypothetical protein
VLLPRLGVADFTETGIRDVEEFLTNEDFNTETLKATFLSQPKIVSQNIVAHVQYPASRIIIMATVDPSGDMFSVDTVNNTVLTDEKFDLRYILALMNCKFTSWFAYRFIYCSAIRTMHFDNYYVGKIPIIDLQREKQKPFIDHVNKILAITKDEDYLSNPAKQARVKELERQIDQMVYELYGLTPDEIAIVEGKK